MIKKVLIFSFLLIAAARSFGQTLEDIGKLMDDNKHAEAKVAIDKYMADPKHGSDVLGWYYKGRIYNSLSRDAGVSKADAYSYKQVAYDAFKKNQQLDPKDVWMKSESYKSYLDLYLGLYDLGAQEFNAQNFTASYNAFTKAQEIEDFILSKNYTYTEAPLYRMDTSLVMNQAAAAFAGKDTASGIKSYRRIADANIGGKDYQNMYEYLAGYYSDHNNEAEMQGIIAKGKTLYPSDNYWNQLEMQRLSASGDKKALFAGYEDLFKKDPADYTNTYNYAAELYNYLYGKDAKDPDPVLKDKLTEVLKAAITNDKGMGAGVLMVNHLYNDAAEARSAALLIKGTKPEDLKKKKDLLAVSDAKMEEAIVYGDKVITYYKPMTNLTTRQKADFRVVAESMSDMYSVKNNPKKSQEYDAIKESIRF